MNPFAMSGVIIIGDPAQSHPTPYQPERFSIMQYL